LTRVFQNLSGGILGPERSEGARFAAPRNDAGEIGEAR
jgi:hypothetical protein